MSYAGIFTDKNNTDHPVTSTLYGTCSTAAATADKVVVCSNVDVLTNGMTLRVVFENGNTASDPTLNVNSLGAKAVYRFGTTKPVGDSSWEAGAVVDLMYNGTSFYMLNSDDIGSIKSDISAKQDATDNTLETTAKTVSGAINEVKSGVNDLEDWTDADAKSVTGNPITITDAAAVKAKALSMTIEPVQDLHGYDKPWVGGAGKNIIPMTVAGIKASNTTGTWTNNVYTLNGVTFEILTDNDNNVIGGKINGTNNSGSGFDIFLYRGNLSSIMSVGETYTITDCSVSDYRTHNYSGTFTVDSDWNITDSMFKIWVGASDTFNNEIRYPQLEVGNQATTFAPYTNYCPITGHTEASVQRDGKNCFNSSDVTDGYYIAEDGTETANASSFISNYMGVASGNYELSYFATQPSQNTRIHGYDKAKNWVSQIDVSTSTGERMEYKTITVPSGVAYVRFSMNKTFTNVQFELGSTATPYEPYAGKTYTIALGDTIYGGTVDFNTGVMTVNRAVVAFKDADIAYNTSQENKPYFRVPLADMLQSNTVNAISSCLKKGSHVATGTGTAASILYTQEDNGTIITGNGWGNAAFRLDGITSVEDLITSYGDETICYILATPTTIQLTPQQIQLLKGTNTLTANGESISLTYQPDNLVGEVMEQVEPQIDDLQGQIDEIPRPLNYSTTEQKTGMKWIDGKDIYVITVSLDPLITINAGDWGATPLSAANIDTITSVSAKMLKYVFGAIGAAIDDGYVNLMNNSRGTLSIDNFTICYTKSTT